MDEADKASYSSRMPVTAKIRFEQNDDGPDAGIAMVGVLTQPVTVSNGDDSDVESWEYAMIAAPPTSDTQLGIVAQGKTPSYTFDPDARGGYLLKLTTTDRNGRVAIDYRVFLVPESSGRYIPPWGATGDALNFEGTTLGWDPIMRAWFEAIDGGGGGGGLPYTVDSDAIPDPEDETNNIIQQLSGLPVTLNAIPQHLIEGPEGDMALRLQAGNVLRLYSGNVRMATIAPVTGDFPAGVGTHFGFWFFGSGCEITSGGGAPDDADGRLDGSIYLQNTGHFFVKVAGAYVEISGGGGGGAVIFDGADALRSTRSDQSPVDNTADGVTNFGSDAGTAGATGQYSTISGGYGHEATCSHATVGGGLQNVVEGSGFYGFATGYQNRVAGVGAQAGGLNANATIITQRALGGGVFTASPSTAGGIQASEIIMADDNPGNVGNALSFAGDQTIYPTLNEPNKTYTITVDAVATAQGVGNSNVSKLWKKVALVRTNGAGVLSIVDDIDVITPLQDAGASAWTLDFGLALASPFAITCIFGPDVPARCVAKMSLVEVVHN